MSDYRSFLREHQVVLAPMAGVTDVAMRQICREHGAQLAFTEMVSAKGLSYANERTSHLIDLYPGENEVGVQIFGHEPQTMAEQARWIETELGPKLAVIDINMGCPARKIVTKGDGASLMQRPDEAYEIIKAVSSSVSVPVTVKFRRGFEVGDETAPDFARMAQTAGASAICVHGRFAKQMYSGLSSRDCIERVCKSVDIPVIGNGDVIQPSDAIDLLERGCSAVMVARGAEGDPWIFDRLRAVLKGEAEPAKPSGLDRIRMARRHARLLFENEPRSVVRMRKQAAWYVKGLPGASVARSHFNECSTIDDFEGVFASLEARVCEGLGDEHA